MTVGGIVDPYRAGSTQHPEIEPDRRWRDRVLTLLVGVFLGLLPLLVPFAEEWWVTTPTSTIEVDELLRGHRPSHAVPVHGILVGGSLTHNGSCEHRFLMEKNCFRMPVRFSSCTLPDSFPQATKDNGSPSVLVTGEFDKTGFVATQLAADVPTCGYCEPEVRERKLKEWRELTAKRLIESRRDCPAAE